MNRIAIVGSGGAGKSTLARRLGDVLGIEVFHLDSLFWQPGWQPTPRDEWTGLQEQLVARERWIVDGNYGSTLPVRLARADTVVFLDLPRFICLCRALRRIASYWGRRRPDMAEGCPEKLDLEYLRWIWRFPRDDRPEVVRQLDALAGHKRVIVLKSCREVARFLGQVSDKARDAGCRPRVDPTGERSPSAGPRRSQ